MHLIERMGSLPRKKKILIVCGTAIATSTMVAYKVEQFMKKNGIQADIRRAMTSEARNASKDADLIISTTQVSGVTIPVLSGIPYITGIGVADLEKQILQALSQSPD